MLQALELCHQDKLAAEIEAALRELGASAAEAASIGEQAQAKFDAELVRSAPLPASARYDLNYYFLLGVTPTASAERIHRAYRLKARDVHPDRHDSEFSREYWTRLMTLIADAHEVLSDPVRRRAYDVVWRERSKKLTIENRRKGEVRGDWETRYRWEMAELSETEDDMSDVLDQIKLRVAEGQPAVDLGQRLLFMIENYESEILEIRTETHTLPPLSMEFGDTVRHEMQRKERLVSGMQQLGAWLADATHTPTEAVVLDHVATAERVIAEVRIAQNQFDIASLR